MDSRTTIKPGHLLRRERQLRGWSQKRVAEEVGTDTDTVSKWERGINLPNPYFREKLIALFGKDAAELGLLDQQSYNDDPPKDTSTSDNKPTAVESESSNALDKLQDIQIQSSPGIITIQQHLTGSSATPLASTTFHIYIPTSIGLSQPYSMERTPVPVDVQAPNTAYSLYGDNAQTTTPETGSTAVNRRDFFRQTGYAAVTGTALLATHDIPSTELLGRFNRALKRPATVDERLLNYLQSYMESYWKDHYHAALSSHDLLNFVEHHFQQVLKVLQNPLLPSARINLCTTASGTALLIGTLLFDIGDYTQSREYFTAAIQAAYEANHYTLQAVGWGWMSLTWIYGENLQEALASIQAARHLASQSDSITVRTWLAAIEAETHARMHNSDACRKALDEAEKVKGSEQYALTHYWTSYDKVQFEGYQGTCYRLLYEHEDKRTHGYLLEAQRALQEALAETDPVINRLQSILLGDLATTYAQQREIEQACNIARQALITNVLQSQMVIQRVLTLRQDLEPWRNVQDVKDLDAFLASSAIKPKLN